MEIKSEETDVESSSEKTLKNISAENAELSHHFTREQMDMIKHAYASANLDDPILLLKWNPQWLQDEGNEEVQQEVITHFLTHGGTDTQESGFILHFQMFQTLNTAKESLRLAVPAAFHYSPGTAAQISQQYNIVIPESIAMAQAWLILKTAVFMTDYHEEKGFFCL